MLLFALCTLTVLIYAIINRKNRKNLIPGGICLLVLMPVGLVPFTQITLKIEFERDKEDRSKVIEMVRGGALKPNVTYNPSLIHLPEQYEKLSKGGGDIVVEGEGDDLQVLFFTFRGALDHFSGFVYTGNGTVPEGEVFGSRLVEVDRLGRNWFFIRGG
ncbi:hypothetical protein K0T92_19685 [Paenibacillus oenotherae]|uniref:Uncharacterized protein n=1 Tax=Paenibacillus oenotherae TaxID=1435645 RepID=A0ABS7DAH1_9BACL|nr:hypothetical protein [Paenibacillus oenotherae]MBW7476943.1 hypothetical protein [Paenibacillus oenotherae]